MTNHLLKEKLTLAKFFVRLEIIAIALLYIAILAGFTYSVIYFLVGLNVTYLQVLGVLLVIDMLKGFFKDY